MLKKLQRWIKRLTTMRGNVIDNACVIDQGNNDRAQ